jgi:hypothetical protein
MHICCCHYSSSYNSDSYQTCKPHYVSTVQYDIPGKLSVVLLIGLVFSADNIEIKQLERLLIISLQLIIYRKLIIIIKSTIIMMADDGLLLRA